MATIIPYTPPARYYLRIKTAPFQEWTVPKGWDWPDLADAIAGARKAAALWMTVELRDGETKTTIPHEEPER